MPAPLTAIGQLGELIQHPNFEPPNMRVWDLPKTRRAKELRARASFCRGTQHDHLSTRWDGRPRDPGVGYLWERMRPQGFVPTNAAPYPSRRPDASYPLPRQIVMRFTDMLFGEGRYPTLAVAADQRTEAFLQAIMKASDAWDALSEGRDYAGEVGSAAISLGIVEGKPVAEAHESADLWVARWKPGANWIPEEVIEQRLVEQELPNEETGKLETVRMWRTRFWNEICVVNYQDVPEKWGREDGAPIPLAKTADGKPSVVEHKAGRCPVVWMQNTRNAKSPEGRSDIEGVYHLCDALDRLQSMVVRGSIANVDPTLVRKIEERLRRRRPVEQKGHGALMDVGPGGDAKFLETSGSSIEMGWHGITQLRDEILQTVGCVLVTPENAGAYKSGEALQMLWRAMEQRCNRLRVPLDDQLKQIAEIWRRLGLEHGIGSTEEPEAGGILLPPVVRDVSELPPEQRPVIELTTDPASGHRHNINVPIAVAGGPGPINEAKTVSMPHEVGDGQHVDVGWPPYHMPTPIQLQAMATGLGVATGQKPSLSQETAVGVMTKFLARVDPAEEMRRIRIERERGMSQFSAAMFPGGEEELEVERAAAAEEEAEHQGEQAQKAQGFETEETKAEATGGEEQT